MKFARATPLGAALSTLVASLSLALTAGTARAAEPVAAAAIHVDTSGENLEIFDRTALVTMAPVRVGRSTVLQRSNVYSTLCTQTPCDTPIAPGTHFLAASKPGGSIIAAEAPVVITGPSKVNVDFVDRSAVRIAGVVALPLSLLLGMALTTAALSSSETHCTLGPSRMSPSCSTDTNTGLLVAGAAIGAGGALISMVLMFQADAVSFSVTPLTLGAPHETGRATATSIVPNGLGLTMRF